MALFIHLFYVTQTKCTRGAKKTNCFSKHFVLFYFIIISINQIAILFDGMLDVFIPGCRHSCSSPPPLPPLPFSSFDLYDRSGGVVVRVCTYMCTYVPVCTRVSTYLCVYMYVTVHVNVCPYL